MSDADDTIELLDTLIAALRINGIHSVDEICSIASRAKRRIRELEGRWIPVSERLPDSGKRVRFHWLNALGKHRTTEGIYCGQFQIEEDWADDNNEAFDWKNDTPYRKAGWYEEPHEGEYYFPVDGVTHWMPLPEPPQEPA